MDKLKKYLASLTPEEKKRFAERCKTSIGQLIQIAGGYRRSDQTLAVNIERETGGKITVADLRPEHAQALKNAGYQKATA